VRRPGPHPTRPSSTKFTSPAPKRTRHEKQNFPLPDSTPHVSLTLHIPT
jgi:hypothetical protein